MRSGSKGYSHRFVVIYRREQREIESAAEEWRGWVERVPEPRQRALENQRMERLSFQHLLELPELINKLIEQSAAATSAEGRNSK